MKQRHMLTGILIAMVFLMAGISSARQRTHVYSYSSSEKRGWLGVSVEDVTSRLKERKDLSVSKGAYVNEVTDESPAEKAKIKEGDVIVKFDGKSVDESNDLIDAVRKTKPNSDVSVEVVRGKEHLTLSATVGKTPGSYSYGFTMPRMPRMPRMPIMPRSGIHIFSTESDLQGLEVQDLGKQLADYFEIPDRKGVLVTSVEKNSSADKAGFAAGDVIVKFDGNKVRDISDLRDALEDVKKDEEVPCDVIRKGKTVSMKWKVEATDREDSEDDDESSWNGYFPENDFHGSISVPRHEVERLKETINNEIRYHLKDRLYDFRTRLHDAIARMVRSLVNA